MSAAAHARGALVALAVAAASCDPARDGAFKGPPLATFVARPDGGGGGAFELVLRWGFGADGGAIDTPIDVSAEGDELTLALYDVPPPIALRSAAHGTFALGEITALRDGEPIGSARFVHVAFAPDGASGPEVGRGLVPGFSLVYPSGPCAHAGVTVHAFAPGTPGLVVSVDGAVDYRFYAPGCPALADLHGRGELDLRASRWRCRFSGIPADAWCSDAEAMIFPEGADADTCHAWRAWCDHPGRAAALCAGEERVCLAPEPPRADPCDLDCACAKHHRACVAAGHPASECQTILDKCHQY